MSAGPADKVLDTFKTLVWDVLVDKAITLALAAIPFASWGFFAFLAGPLTPIIRRLIIWFTDILYSLVRDGINLGFILLNNEIHHAAFVTASEALTLTFDKFGMDSPEFRKDRDARKASMAKFVRYAS